MKLLLDENLLKRLKLDFSYHQVFTVRDMGWNGIKNGELISLMINQSFDALLTFDKNLQHQQNFAKYPICVFILIAKNNTYLELTTLSKMILDRLENQNIPTGPVIISKFNG